MKRGDVHSKSKSERLLMRKKGEKRTLLSFSLPTLFVILQPILVRTVYLSNDQIRLLQFVQSVLASCDAGYSFNLFNLTF